MKTITLKIDDSITDNFFWLLNRFSEEEVRILEQRDYVTDDDYLRSIPGMVESLKKARKEPMKNGISMQQLGW